MSELVIAMSSSMKIDNLVQCSENAPEQHRIRYEVEKDRLAMLASQGNCIIFDMGEELYLAVDACDLVRELDKAGASSDAETYIIEVNRLTWEIYKEQDEAALYCNRQSGKGEDFVCEHYIWYTVEYQDAPEVEGRQLNHITDKNETLTNDTHGRCPVRKRRVEYAANMGYMWVFSLWRADSRSALGGYIRRYACSAQDLLALINSRKLYEERGSYTLYVRYEDGEVHTSGAFTLPVLKLTPVAHEEYPGLLKIVPSSSVRIAVAAANGGDMHVSSGEEKVMPQLIDIETLCRLLDERYRRGARVDNKTIINTILSYARMALGDDEMLALLQDMEQKGTGIPWALDATDYESNALNALLCDVVNGYQHRRYYGDPICVCGRTYYISSQWYSHIQYPNQEQTKKALLQMICRRLSTEHSEEYMRCLVKKACQTR